MKQNRKIRSDGGTAMTMFDWLVIGAIGAAAYLALFTAVALLEWRERQRKERVLTEMRATERRIQRKLDEADK